MQLINIRTIASATLTLAVFGGATACSSAGQDGAADGSHRAPQPVVSKIPGVKKVEPRSDTAGLSLPIDEFMAKGSDLEQTARAMTVLETRCASRFGFSLKLPEPTSPGFGKNTRRYGVPESLEVAQKFGFHMPKNDPRAAKNRSGVPPTEEQMKILTGSTPQGPVKEYHGIAVPEGGCAGEAGRAISGSDDARAGHSPRAEEIRAHSFELSRQDPRVIAAQAAWVKCMSAQGYSNYKTSFDAGGDSRWNTPVATSQEIAVALADWNCAKSANLVGVWAAIETAYQNTQIDQHAEELKQAQADLRAQAKRVASIVSGATPAS
ncbi:hypothetical protein ACH4A8_39620 [Streptomyces vietnamensis]|uniref:hypothetical protein n=1 Tax=Streptomyces vietnamensis TaxID=362257 RepID=UPI00341E5044